MPRASDKAARLVQIQNVTKAFGMGPSAVKALDDVSLSIMANEFFTLLGPSGCGKTTLLRLLAGFEHPTSGVILLDDKYVVNDPPNKRPVNTVFQSYALFPHMTIEQNVAFGLERQGLQGAKVTERVAAMLRLVRLETLAQRRPHQLSGGQQQRVALARALAPQPRLLLLDEPLSALDLKLRRGMQVELKRIQRETGITFVLVTHDQEEALSMSDRIAVMEGGRVLQLGAPADIYERPNCRFVADFIGESNVLPGAILGLASAFAAIRPERVGVLAGSAPHPTGLPGHVAEVTYLGATTSCTITLENGLTVKAERGDLPASLTPGQAVTCLFPPDALLALEA
jgi:spermidine/putrescine transport system ATP-binding protein